MRRGDEQSAALLATYAADALCAVGLSGGSTDLVALADAILVACALGALGLLLHRVLAWFGGRDEGAGSAAYAALGRGGICLVAAWAGNGQVTGSLVLAALALASYTMGVRSWTRRGGLYDASLRDATALLDGTLLLAAHRPGLAAGAGACFIAARCLRRPASDG